MFSLSSDVLEYCENDIFQPKCGSDEVLLITHARYGRMRQGRCITGQHGKFGCKTDARRYLDQRCSGRRSCTVTVATLVPEDVQPCSKDLRIVYASKDYCENSEAVEVRESAGYLSSLVTMETGCGSLDSPWWVTVQPGQTITLSLLDFDVREEQGASQSTETVCAGNTRERLVFTSSSNRLEVRLVTGSEQSERRDSHFLLRFEAHGCPDLPPPINGWVERNANYVMIGCHGDARHRWKLRCEGIKWSGTYNNCTDGEPPMAGSALQSWSLLNMKHGLSALIILCIAVLVGLGILAVGLFYIRRKRHTRSGREVMVRPPPDIQYGPSSVPDKPEVPLSRPYSKTGDSTEYYHSTENDYYRTWQMQRHVPQNSPLPAVPTTIPPPPYHAKSPVLGGESHLHATSGNQGKSGYQKSTYPPNEHIYESPKFERKDYSSDDYEIDGINTEYFELDPDSSKTT
ncbi:hypothetical protein LSH36_577g02040 [Paralvinella palmiformis]|uniref:SUEL-type lectin domain-containing protein n=1 Tax=Paralvinella palmiformis TaxID=53620 RepID=A0AAD9J781_9ANNE|nr:hypothetical protein LSH36_577g02040 [Paralvinella palmiformis]